MLHCADLRWPTIVALAAALSAGTGPELRAQLERPLRFAPRIQLEVREEATEADAADVTLPENGDLKRKLEIVRRQLQSQKFAEATRQIGRWLQDDRAQDFFVARDEDRRDGVSFKAELRRLLKELPAEGREVYLAQFGVVARQRLAQAVERGDESSLRDVMLGFPETPAAAEAQFRLGRFLADHGRPHAAALCLSRLRAAATPAATASPFEPALSLLLAACWLRSGESPQAAQILQELSAVATPVPPRIGHRTVRLPFGDRPPPVEQFAVLTGAGRTQADAGASDWSHFRGNVERNRLVPAAAPFLAPRWRHSVADDVTTQSSIESALQAHREGTRVCLPMLQPLVVGQLVLTRTARGVRALDRESGAFRWSYPTDDDGAVAGLEQMVWMEPAGGAFSADAERLYVLERLPTNAETVTAAGFNLLTACDLAGGREGNLRWRVGGGDGGNDSRLAGTRFLGPPVSWHGRLYVIGEMQGTVWLFVLEAATGRLHWSQELATVRDEAESTAFRHMAGAVPSISSDDVIVCPTSGGAIVALDLTMQSLSWAYRYPRKIRNITDPQVGIQPRLDQDSRWIDATVTLVDGKVLATPLESDELHCLNLADGRPLWTRQRGNDLYLACVSGESAVLIGRREVSAVKLADGQPAWPCSLSIPDAAYPSGRGVSSGTHYFLPTTAAQIVQFTLHDGQLSGRYKSLRESVPGNLVWHDRLFISQGGQYLEAFDEFAALTTRVAGKLEKNPHEPESLLRQGELLLYAGRHDEALEHFRRAHAAAGTSRAKSALVAALLQVLRSDPAHREGLAAELDQLIDRP